MNNIITPYQGWDKVLFTMDYSTVRNMLTDSGIKYTIEHWPNKGCMPEVAWDIIRIENGISLFFAKDRMFKMYFERGFEGALNNGICIGMSIDDAKKLDINIEYNDDNEEYISPSGYWLEESLLSGKIESITVFIPEVLDDEKFFSYEWCN